MKMQAKNLYPVLAIALLSTPMLLTNAQTIPHISSISPASATYGATITITGSGFDLQNNDIGFVKVKQDDTNASDHIGYVNNVPSDYGKTLVFKLPQDVGVCPRSIDPDRPCIMIALVLEEGQYEIFVLNKNGKSNSMMFAITSGTGGPLTKNIPTSRGELALDFDDGTATLSGVLQRSTPCVDWLVNVMMTKDKPPSQVEFQIYDANKDAICIQVLGKPQTVKATAPAGQDTFYKVMLEDEVVFSGKLTGSSVKEAKGNVYVKSIGETGKLVTSWDYKEDKGIIILFGEENRMLVRFTLSSSTCVHDSEECIEGVVISSNSEEYSKESKIRLEIERSGTLYLASLDNSTPQNEHSFSMKKLKSTVTVNGGQREGPLLVEGVFPDHIVGLNFPEFPIAVGDGLPVTLRIGDTVSNGCTVRLKLLDIHDDSATFLKTIEQKEICPICWHNKAGLD
jgi:hypothetical protein